MESEMESLGLRERKKARTYDQIAEVALRLFTAQGYEQTTLEEIAAEADVHKRTLLRYFPTKAHLVLHRRLELLESFREELRRRGATPALVIWRNHVITNARSIARTGSNLNVAKISASEPILQGSLLAIQMEYEKSMRTELRRDYPNLPDPDVRIRVAAAALIGGNYAVGTELTRREAFRQLEKAVLKVIDLVRERLLED